MSNSPKQLSNAQVSVFNLNSSGGPITGIGVVQLDSTGGIISGGAGGGSTQVSVKEILTSSGASMVDSTNNALNVTIRAGSAAGTEYTDGDVDASVSGSAILFGNSSNTLRHVNSTRGLPVNIVAGALSGIVTTQPSFNDASGQTIGALNDAAITSLGAVVFQIPTGLTGTISFESSIDGAGNWTAEGAWLSDGTYATSVNSFPVWGVLPTPAYHRLRISAYTSGSVAPNITYYTQALIPVGTNVRGTVTVQQSTATDLLARVSQGVRNSSGADAWPTASVDSSNTIVKPGDSANNALRVNVVAGSAASTIVTVSTGSVRVHQSTATDLLARVNQGVGNSSLADRWIVNTANSSAADYHGVRLVDSSGTGYHGPTKPLPVSVTDSSNAVVLPGDSANNAVRVNVVASAAGGTEYADGDVDASPNGLAVFFNNSSNTMRAVSATLGLPVNVIGGSISASTVVTVSTGSVRVHQSTATDLLARVNQGVGNSSAADRWLVNTANSSAADYHAIRIVDSSGTGYHGPSNPMPMAVTDSSNAVVKSGDSANNAIRVNVVAGAAGGSTIVTVSTGSVRVHQSSAADFLNTVYQSSAADLRVTIYPQSSVAPSSGSSAVLVRPVIDRQLTASSTGAFGGGSGSTSFNINSTTTSTLRCYVTGYSITSTNQTPFTVGFYSSGSLLWPIKLAAISSAVTGVNLAVSPPGYLFCSSAGEAMTLRIDQSSRTGDVVAVCYFLAP